MAAEEQGDCRKRCMSANSTCADVFCTLSATRQVPELYDNMPVDEFVGSQSVYPNYTGRRTKNGQPLYVYRISALTKERINKYSAEADRLEPRMIALSEMMTAFTLPMATALPRPEPNVPIDSTVSSECLPRSYR